MNCNEGLFNFKSHTVTYVKQAIIHISETMQDGNTVSLQYRSQSITHVDLSNVTIIDEDILLASNGYFSVHKFNIYMVYTKLIKVYTLPNTKGALCLCLLKT